MKQKPTTATTKHRGIGRRSELFPDVHLGEVAKRVGITRSYLSSIINGGRRPSMETAITLAKVLGISVGDVAKMFKGNNSGSGSTRQKTAA